MKRILIVGLGNMGISHALAYHKLPSAQVVGLVNRSPVALPPELSDYPVFTTFEAGMETRPDIVVVATYSDSHAD